MSEYESSVFINCPFDDEFAPLLEAMLFCVVRAEMKPRLASERLEAGENRLDKILELIASCKFSIHDLSRATARAAGENFRMNMPFELGLDWGRRKAPDPETTDKKFIIFEFSQYELKKCLSDLAGTDVAFHKGELRNVFKALRDFLRVEAGAGLPGPTQLKYEYDDFLGWMTEKKISEGHTEREATELPTQERLEEMTIWMNSGRPIDFAP